jgi:hypothetical protein
VKGSIHSFIVVFVVAVMLILLQSCEEKKQEKVLSRDEMVKVLTEIYVIEDKINRLTLERDSSEKIFEMMFQKISDKTGYPDTLIKKSLTYYRERPAEMQKIYTALVDSLSLREQRAAEPPTPE